MRLVQLYDPGSIPGTLPELTNAGVVEGASVEGRFTYSLPALDSNSNPTIGNFFDAVRRTEIRVGSHQVIDEVWTSGHVRNDAGWTPILDFNPSTDVFEVSGVEGPPYESLYVPLWYLSLVDSSAEAFDSDAMPHRLPELVSFDPYVATRAMVTFWFPGRSERASAAVEITSLELQSVSTPPPPNPPPVQLPTLGPAATTTACAVLVCAGIYVLHRRYC